MDRRQSIKAIALGTVSTGVILEACKEPDKKASEQTASAAPKSPDAGPDRQPEEVERYKKLSAEKFFTEQEMAAITILADIIIPRDEISGSASEAKVPEFIDFIVKDMPQHQTPLRGGLKWLDLQCLKRYEKSFKDCSEQQRMEMINEIAWPKKAKPEMAQGVSFFNRMRDLTATGFYTSQIGIKDLGYAGNVPNQWNGVPDDVLKQYGLAYDERELKESVQF
jgi:gluconate 2-dehydrogenase gamma chain